MANAISNVNFQSPEQMEIDRRRQMAQALHQQGNTPMGDTQVTGGWAIRNSPIQGLAKMLQSYSGRKGIERADEEAKALRTQQQATRGQDMSVLVNALQGRQASPAGLQEDAAGIHEMPAQAAQTPLQGLQKSMPMIQDPQMQQIAFQQYMNQIEKENAPPSMQDLGDRIALVKNGKIVGYMPKGETPDARLRDRGETTRHREASGSAQLGANTTISVANITNDRTRSEGAANRATTERGQDLVNARAIEANAYNRDNKPLTEPQAKASVFHSQMTSASDALAKIPGYDPNSGVTQADTAVAGGRGNMIASESAQRAKQAQSQWAEAFLRFKTGAASTPAEVALNVATFFPQIGDKPGVIKQKAEMRAQAERDLSMAAGKRTVIQRPQEDASADPLGLRG